MHSALEAIQAGLCKKMSMEQRLEVFVHLYVLLYSREDKSIFADGSIQKALTNVGIQDAEPAITLLRKRLEEGMMDVENRPEDWLNQCGAVAEVILVTCQNYGESAELLALVVQLASVVGFRLQP